MKDIIALQQKIAPELIELLERRYTIIRTISLTQPVGRRFLAHHLKLGERQVRSETEFLKNQGLLESDSTGMKVTAEGERLLVQLAEFIKNLHGLVETEEFIAQSLGLKKVIIVPGNSDKDGTVKKEMGRAAARFIREILFPGAVMAVTGGTTLREVAATMPVGNAPHEITVVPARGGLGEDVEVQANTIAAIIAKKLRGTYRLLHVPDNLKEEAIRLLVTDQHIKELVAEIKSADILVHGIGNARELSESRGDSPEETEELISQGAVGEAFGHYFAADGSIVKNIHSLGIRLRDLRNISTVIAVAGGEKKAAAILSVLKNNHEDVLITDQGAANKITALIRG
ncbi:DeoR family transcriptional regulator [Thermincola ferriacetica]|uniref:DeoR family transcriptional regulator n=1 Tax=Thermincola ferriacetica TaxID=281456 RepID=A0A0L6W3S4_9FIRM|nr:sugar-binding domain-containing protein [Thermincola ferriacetica]KNZ70013.1 DeoR family transcriptional regulator [Thermincola ferriacetica]